MIGTPEQKAAYVNAQAALLNGEIEMMSVANRERESCGSAPAYGEAQFLAVLRKFEAIIGHDACFEMFQK